MFRCSFLWLTMIPAASAGAEPPQLIVHHARIVTLNPRQPAAEALAIRDDRIVAVGSNAEIRKLADKSTREIDAGGKCLIPGLIDSHVHPTGAAMYEYDHPIPEMDTVADVLKHVAQRAEQLEDGEWILLSQVFITRLRDQRYPTRTELDQAAPRNPVKFQTGPDCAVNSLALKLSGIDKDFQLPPGDRGLIERDDAGEPTGILRNASQHIKAKSPEKSPQPDEQRERLRLLFADYNSVGLTSIADRGAGEGSIKLYQQLQERGELTLRVFCSHTVSGGAAIEDVEQQIQKVADHPLHQDNRWIWVRGIKVFLDGGMLTGSAYMKQPWGVSDIYSIRDPEYRGLRFIPQENLVRMAKYALERNLQFTAHSVGDGAVEALAEAYVEIDKSFKVAPHRPCVTHCNFMSAQAIANMKAVGIVADLQPAWLWLDGATLTKQFGPQRLEFFQPYRTLFDEGVVVGGGSDHMQKIGGNRSVNPYNPFLGMWIAITRQPRRMDGPLHAGQRISREEALRLYTLNNAWLTFEEQHKGSLEPGKLADFAILNADILTCPEEEIPDITVSATFVGGQQVYPPAAK